MKFKNIRKLKGQIALEKAEQEQGASIAEVRLEIQNTIDLAMANTDLAVQAFWKYIYGKPLSPEKLVEILLKNIKDG